MTRRRSALAGDRLPWPMKDETPRSRTGRPGYPLGRPGHAREVAAAIAFPAGPSAS